ncbi:MAG: Gfo/Idh/MocA family oxidoreductase [Chitinophagaceae bacterium]|nr:Gfo/Idh/MocA family oxidoreductase [Chitinophagaceae bacterium]
MRKSLRMGMVGGGPDAFIGAVHRIAARMDGMISLVCGSFSSDPQKSKVAGELLELSQDRVYPDYKTMIEKESALPENERMDFISIVTPNHVHFEPAKLALEAGFDVVIDKPVTFSLEEAKQLKQIIDSTGRVFALTHTYTGYPMVKQAKEIVASGKLGTIRKVYVEYLQGWLYNKLEDSNQKQAAWRTDPKRSGKAGCMGDIGTHAFNLAEYVTGQKVTSLCANLNTVVPGRLLDDDGAVLLCFDNGATGTLMASQVCTGAENNIRIRVFGDQAGLEWQQEDCNSLTVYHPDGPRQVWRTGTGYAGGLAVHNTRTPAGHPEGYLEAFANIYRNAVQVMLARRNNIEPVGASSDFPGIEEGVRGMAFVENVVAASGSSEKWKIFEV